MYVDASSVKIKDKTHTRYLLRESFREHGKVKHKTIANISHCSLDEIKAIQLALRHKKDLANLGSIKENVTLQQGPSIGAIWVTTQIAKQIGIEKALGSDRQGKLALWQVIARVIDQGSRLSATRLAQNHPVCGLLGLTPFNEDSLYANLDWLSDHQAAIETHWFRRSSPASGSGVFLYDVTSSYLEGEKNALAAFGYNRDGKKGKRQVVIGLLCNEEGVPLAIEVFAGNTQDPKTFMSQVKKVADRLGGVEVTFVGDRGMIKSAQVDALLDHQYHYVTAITKPQIETLLKQGVLQMNLFDDMLAEVTDEKVRYILRRNPIRTKEMVATRDSKYQRMREAVAKANEHLVLCPKASVEVALRKLTERRRRLCIVSWTGLSCEGRVIVLTEDQEDLSEIAKLDGCYVLKTDLSDKVFSKEVIHHRYKDLALVEWAFRESKTGHLEMRPIYVRRESRTRGHALVVMLAYCIIRELSARWAGLDCTVEEGLKQLGTLCVTEVRIKDQTPYQAIPTPSETVGSLLKVAGVVLPSVFPNINNKGVATRKKLQTRRK